MQMYGHSAHLELPLTGSPTSATTGTLTKRIRKKSKRSASEIMRSNTPGRRGAGEEKGDYMVLSYHKQINKRASVGKIVQIKRRNIALPVEEEENEGRLFQSPLPTKHSPTCLPPLLRPHGDVQGSHLSQCERSRIIKKSSLVLIPSHPELLIPNLNDVCDEVNESFDGCSNRGNIWGTRPKLSLLPRPTAMKSLHEGLSHDENVYNTGGRDEDEEEEIHCPTALVFPHRDTH